MIYNVRHFSLNVTSNVVVAPISSSKPAMQTKCLTLDTGLL